MQPFHRAGLAPSATRSARSWSTSRRGTAWSPSRSSGTSSASRPRCALADFAAADPHAAAADHLAERTSGRWWACSPAVPGAATRGTPSAAYRDAAARLDGAGMPGLEHGLLGLALLCLAVRARRPPPRPPTSAPTSRGRGRCTRPLLPTRRTICFWRSCWCLTAHAARPAGDDQTLARAREASRPAAHELAAGSGIVTLGPVALYLG